MPMIIENHELLKWILTNIPNIDINNVSHSHTLLTECITYTKSSDKWFDNIKLLISHKARTDIPKQQPPIFYAIRHKKLHVVEYLLPHIVLND